MYRRIISKKIVTPQARLREVAKRLAVAVIARSVFCDAAIQVLFLLRANSKLKPGLPRPTKGVGLAKTRAVGSPISPR